MRTHKIDRIVASGIAASIVWLLLPQWAEAQGGPASTSDLLPAYSHNDYRNVRPLFDALDAGYRGVEVDCFYVEGRLLVAHDRRRVRTHRDLEGLYLRPLRDRVRRSGTVLPDSIPFFLHVELKGDGEPAYEALRLVLSRYEEILQVVRDGQSVPGPVQIVLVGWAPSLEELVKERVRYVSVQRHDRDLPEGHEKHPSHLVSMVSLEYGSLFRWNGISSPDSLFAADLRSLVRRAHAAPGRLLRVYEVPLRRNVYRALLEAGVDRIGTKTLAKSRAILLEIQNGSE